MATGGKLMATPRLRFPEFQRTRGWTSTELGQLAEFVTERVGTTECTPYTVTSGVGLVSQQEKLGRTIAGNSFKNYVVLRTNDFAYNKSATKAFPQGFIARYLGDGRAAVPNSIFTCFRVDEKMIAPIYLDYLFSSNLHGQWLRSRITVGARAHGSLNVNDNDLMALPVPLPDRSTSLKEQQRIADCLASLDEVIAAQWRKVEALKGHKRGLMQQLFPGEGDTLPRLRFPEFRDALAWKDVRLNELGTLVSGLTYSPSDVQDDGLLVLRSSNIQNSEITLGDCVFVNPSIKGANLSRPNDILICVRNGSKALIGKSALVPEGMPLCTHGAFMTVFRAHAPAFVFQLIQSAAFHKQVSADLGATINSINGGQLLKYRFVVPEPEEQNRIAECLSSLSAQIAAESASLEALKIHKKGLMQQLFPSPEEH